MDKQDFLGLLKERLTALEVSEENTNKYIRQFERYFNTMTDDEVNDQIENYEGVEGIAQNILKLIKKKQDTAQKLSPSAPKEGDVTITYPITYPVTALKKEKYDKDSDTREIDTVKNNNQSDNIEAASDKNNENPDAEDKTETSKASDDSIALNEENDPTCIDDIAESDGFTPEERQQFSVNKEEQRHPAAKEQKVTLLHLPEPERIERLKQGHAVTGKSNIVKHTGEMVPARRAGSSPDINISELDESYIEDTAIPNTTLYWVIILLTIPLSVPLLLTVLFLFIAAFAFLAVSIVALIAALIFVVVSGTGLSLVGIIYGITQIYTSLPIGLFEIGFGVIIGGSAMLSGIFIYNTAIRFLPFVIKYLIVFFMFTMYKIKDFFKFVKKECAKQ